MALEVTKVTLLAVTMTGKGNDGGRRSMTAKAMAGDSEDDDYMWCL